MEKILEQIRKIKGVVPKEKQRRIMIESDGHTPRIIINNQLSEFQISAKDIEEIKKLEFVKDVRSVRTRENELEVVIE